MAPKINKSKSQTMNKSPIAHPYQAQIRETSSKYKYSEIEDVKASIITALASMFDII